MNSDAISKAIIGAAMRVHTELGPGLLESAYRACLTHELRLSGFKVEPELRLPIEYRGLRLDAGYRIDLLVENLVGSASRLLEIEPPPGRTSYQFSRGPFTPWDHSDGQQLQTRLMTLYRQGRKGTQRNAKVVKRVNLLGVPWRPLASLAVMIQDSPGAVRLINHPGVHLAR
jgi:hypothetical protein